MAFIVLAASTVAALAQLPAARATLDPPVRVGDIATVLPAADVNEIVRVSACGSATPWLLIGSSGQAADVQFIEVFCAADTASPRIRRGSLAWVMRRAARDRAWGPWTLEASHRYAQVLEVGRRFDSISGVRDRNRPIRIRGTVLDEDLVHLVKFLGESPSRVGGTERDRVEGSWPVTQIIRETDGMILAVLSKDSWESQHVRLRRAPGGWEVVRVELWMP